MSEQERSNTAGNSGKRGKPFAKGDARINRKGRPKTFDALRKEALKIAGEIVVNPKTGEEASVVHAILRSWASGDAQALHGWLPSFNEAEMRAEPYSLLVLANQCRALGSLDGTIPLSPEHRTALIDAARALRRNVSRIARGDHQQA